VSRKSNEDAKLRDETGIRELRYLKKPTVITRELLASYEFEDTKYPPGKV